MEVHPAGVASAKNALAAHHAAERAVEEHGEDAAINPDDFRSIAPPDTASAAGATDADEDAEA